MNFRRIVVLPLVSFVVLQSANLPVFAYTQASDVALAERSPFFTQQTLDSDYRLQGLGGLDLPVMDDANKVGTFKYGDAPAGLPLDYEQNKAELSLFSEGGIIQDNQSNGSSYVGDLAEVNLNVFQGMVAFRTGSSPESHGVFAAGFIGEAADVEYDSGYEGSIPVKEITNEPSLSSFKAGYGHQLGNILFGVGLHVVDAMADDTMITYLSGASASIKDKLKYVDVVPSVGYSAPLSQGKLSFTFSPRIRSMKDEVTFGSFSSKTEEDGILFDAGVHYGNGETIQSALYLTTGETDGDITDSHGHTADSSTDEMDLRFRTYFQPTGSRFSFGVLAESLNTETEQQDETGVLAQDDEFTSLSYGVGTAFHFADQKGLIGLELRGLRIDNTDNLTSNNNVDGRGYQLALGGEFALTPRFTLRGGLNRKSIDETPSSQPTLNLSTNQLAVGGEFKLNDRASVALNLISSHVASEGSASENVDEQEYGALSLQLAGKFYFGGKPS